VNLRGLIKTGVALKALEFVKREASKPENQAKAKDLAKTVQQKMAERKGSRSPGSAGTTTPTAPGTTPAPKP
jgi:hypothetical protein